MKTSVASRRSPVLASALFLGVAGGLGLLLAKTKTPPSRPPTVPSHVYTLSPTETLTLPNATTVRLRAVISPRGNDSDVWRPDGKPLSPEEAVEMPMRGYLGQKAAWIDVRFPFESDTVATAMAVNYDGEGKWMTHRVVVPMEPGQTEASFLLGRGPWESVATFDARGARVGGNSRARLTTSLTQLQLTHDLPEANFRLVALLPSGAERLVNWSQCSDITKSPITVRYNADGQTRKWSDAIGFRLDRRPWERVTFYRLPLMPLR